MHPHNWLLEVLLAGGFLALSGFAWTAWRVYQGPSFENSSTVVLASLTALLVVSMAFDSPFPVLRFIC
jgi:hypothetical protein